MPVASTFLTEAPAPTICALKKSILFSSTAVDASAEEADKAIYIPSMSVAAPIALTWSFETSSVPPTDAVWVFEPSSI